MQVEFSSSGIYLPEIDLWLDPAAEVASAWLSHAHSDHARGLHRNVWGTPETLRFYRQRWPDPDNRQTVVPMPFDRSIEFRGARLTAIPAGHILGAAQILIEYRDERSVYTGDAKLRPPLCGETARVVPCDRLILESTFGLPIYRFLTREQARERITTFARECLAEGVTPVFLGYPLGRGQEIVHALRVEEIPTGVHAAIAKFLPEYAAAGFSAAGWEPYDTRAISGKALVVTPGMRAQFEARDCRIAYVSGWASLANARARSGAQELIPYSDHADFAELLEFVEKSGARYVDVVHGYTEAFAGILQSRGIKATSRGGLTARTEEDAP